MRNVLKQVGAPVACELSLGLPYSQGAWVVWTYLLGRGQAHGEAHCAQLPCWWAPGLLAFRTLAIWWSHFVLILDVFKT